MIQKRWFKLFKTACCERKRDKQLLLDATLCRFLVLQRTALKSLVLFAAKRREERIQSEYAAHLYYKHLTARTVLSLRIYALAKREAALSSHKKRTRLCEYTEDAPYFPQQ